MAAQREYLVTGALTFDLFKAIVDE